jgi:hypothetical protein
MVVVPPALTVGIAVTVTIVVALHPVPVEYVIVVVPPEIPLTTPEEEPTVPTAVVLLLHVPPEVASAKVVVAPTHTDVVPVIDAGVVHPAGTSTCAHQVSHLSDPDMGVELASCIVQKSLLFNGSRHVPE